MSRHDDDPDGVKSEKTRADGIALGKYRAAVRELRVKWAREGYDPMRHLAQVQQDGDANVLIFMANDEHRRGSTQIGAYLAFSDIWEVLHRRPTKWRAAA